MLPLPQMPQGWGAASETSCMLGLWSKADTTFKIFVLELLEVD